jgi:hypothetical protein
MSFVGEIRSQLPRTYLAALRNSIPRATIRPAARNATLLLLRLVRFEVLAEA